MVPLGALRESNQEAEPALAIVTTPSAAMIHPRLATTFVPSAESRAVRDHPFVRFADPI